NKLDLAKLREKQIPTETIEIIQALVQAERHYRLKDVNQILDAFSTDKTSIEPPGGATTLNAYLKPGDTYDMYEIIELIGEGREAQIYKARNGRLETVALKLFNRDIERERIFREGDNTAAIKSSYVVGCNNIIGHWKDDRYFLVLDYIEGESMRSWIEQQRVPDEGTFRNIAMCLLQGVQAFHNHIDETGQVKTILHSDIKPDNILITRDKKAVIIDFGIAGPPRIDVFQGTLAYIPPDSLSGADMQFSKDGDLFALGITLWEWLCGQRPYHQMTLGEKPCFSPDCLARVPINLQECLMKAIALERENRFLKAEDMIEAFSGIREVEKPDTPDTQINVHEVSETLGIPVSDADQNPFVLYLNSLSNASAGNENATAEAQIGNIFFPNIRVEHPASQFIYRQLFIEKKHVILTGNAGDGKTTIAAEVYRRHFGEYKPLLAREESSDLVMIKDLSELPEEQRTEIFSEAMEHPEKSYLIVSNTGTLIENLSKVQRGRGIEKSQLLTALEADHPLLVGDGKFLIVNIGRINSISAALSVGERMLEGENWQKCSSCSKSKDCPIHINVNLLQENIELVLERIGLAYRRLYEYGNRLTMRQMTGHLAYIITSGLNCENVMAMSKIALEEQYTRYLFFNRFFGDDGRDEIPEAMQLLPVRKIREAELGIYLDPFMERTIWKKQPDELQFSENTAKVLEHIRGNGENSTNKKRIQVRRLLYFLLSPHHQGANQYLSGFLQSPMLLTYLKHVDENKPFTRSQEDGHLRFLLQVLQECFAGVRLLEDEYRSRDLYITLKPPGYSTTQMILGKAHSEDFSLGMKNVYDTGEIKHRILTMRYQVDKAELELDLPFLDYVARRYR
ncbi:MAG: protein kinase domain-containing protein, partial [Enterococcus lemanii]